MEFRLGTRASCSDGHCGEVSRTILDPGTRTITHLVIEHKHRGWSGRLVPVDLVDTAAAGAEIRLRCTLDEFHQLEPSEEVELVNDGYGPANPVQDLGMGIDVGLAARTPVILSDTVPPGEAEVARHEVVHALDGEIGKVEGFAVDADRKVTHVFLQEGHLWGRKEVVIPVSAVTAVDHGIWLNLTKQQVEDLPPLR
jgi:sporulation protein YlmC with PRC-barrel domain